MGTWGAGSFDNDTAADWVYGLERASGYAWVEETLAPVARGEHLDDPYDGEVAIAAAEVVATAGGFPGPNVPPEVHAWAAREGVPPAPLRSLAARAVRAVRDASELRAMWDEQSPEPWLEATADLVRRLGAAAEP
jgi:hypothetical protein